MFIKKETSISINKETKAKLEQLKSESTDDAGNSYESWNSFFSDLVDYFNKEE